MLGAVVEFDNKYMLVYNSTIITYDQSGAAEMLTRKNLRLLLLYP